MDITGLEALFLNAASNLSDLTSATTARTNLGLGTAATRNTGTGGNNILLRSDADARYLLESSNLSDLTNATTARTNLGLGNAALRTVGTADNQIPDINSFAATRAATGRQALPGGLLLQWQTVTGPSDQGSRTYTFPVSFRESCHGVFPVSHPRAIDAGTDWGVQVQSFSRSQVVIYYQGFAGSVEDAQCIYLAIGS